MSVPAPGSYSPATGESIEPPEWTDVDDIAGIVAKARAAQPEWAGRDLDARAAALVALADEVLRRHEEICGVIARETGKSTTEALINEVALIGNYARDASRTARAALAPEKVRISPLDFPGKRASIELVPRGVVGIIAPWNYPFANFYKHFFPALLAGNAVVLKPSEFTPATGQIFADICAEVLPQDLVQIVQGAGEAGAAMLAAVDAITFTGSVPTGRKVAVQAAERLIPCSVELGGKDAAIVLADCHLDRTALGIAQWAIHNAGQNCAAIERVYVEDAIADAFVEKLGKVVGKLRVSTGEGISDLGPLQTHAQRDIVESHVKSALDGGATLVTGGERVGEGLGYAPTVLDHCDDDMEVCSVETFGPVIPIVRVADADEAIERANASVYGLNGSIWTSDLTRGEQLARRLEVGVAYVNNHSLTGTMAQTPWTGVKDTGTGVAASRHSYHTFTRPRTIFVDKGKAPDPFWFPADENLDAFARALVDRSLGSLGALLKLGGLVGKRVKAIKAFVE
jgi:acyl-CoA reductase-like NAD-dependent aldehyde dehydrogenase